MGEQKKRRGALAPRAFPCARRGAADPEGRLCCRWENGRDRHWRRRALRGSRRRGLQPVRGELATAVRIRRRRRMFAVRGATAPRSDFGHQPFRPEPHELCGEREQHQQSNEPRSLHAPTSPTSVSPPGQPDYFHRLRQGQSQPITPLCPPRGPERFSRLRAVAAAALTVNGYAATNPILLTGRQCPRTCSEKGSRMWHRRADHTSVAGKVIRGP